jgi:hypothetical protein
LLDCAMATGSRKDEGSADKNNSINPHAQFHTPG